MVHVPTESNVTVVPDTVQTNVVCELRLTGRPEDDATMIVNGAVPSCLFVANPKVMAWDNRMVVASLLFALADPPPDILTEFVCGDMAFEFTLTVTVIGG